jgi:hypothetical protein
MLRQRLEVRAGLVIEAAEVGVGDELQQVLVAGQVAREQSEMEDVFSFVGPTCAVEAGVGGQIKFATNQRFDALGLRLVVKVDGPVEVAVIRQRQRGHPQRCGPIHQAVDPARAVQQAIVAVYMKMNEIGVFVRHAGSRSLAFGIFNFQPPTSVE